MFSPQYALTKRSLGVLLILLGLLAIAASLALDVLGSGRQGGIGPTQRIGFALAGVLILIGLTLIPLGNRPA